MVVLVSIQKVCT